MNRYASTTLIALAFAIPGGALAFGVSPAQVPVSGVYMFGNQTAPKPSPLAPPRFTPPKYDEAWGKTESTSVLQKLGYNASSWNLVDVTLGKAANDNKAVASGKFVDSAGDILYTSMCANRYYSQTLKKVCSSAPNACGMKGAGFTTQYYGYDPSGKVTGHSSAPCSAVRPPDSLCTVAHNQDTQTGGGGTGGGGGASGTTVTQGQACAAAYTCRGASIIQTLTDCTQKTLDVCVAPQFCSIGSSICLSDSMDAGAGRNGGEGTPTLNGSLSAIPSIVRKGDSAHLFWNVLNASSCVVTDNTGTVSTLTSAGASGISTGPLTANTTFHLHCIGIKGALPPLLDDDAVVNLIPGFQEI